MPILNILFATLPLVVSAPKPPMRDFIGLNTHTIQFKPDLYRPVTKRLRNYHPVEWDFGDNPSNATTFPMARNGVNWYSSVYWSWKNFGYDSHVTLMFDNLPQTSWKHIDRDAFAYGYCFARYFGPSGSEKLVNSAEIGNEPGLYDDETYRKIFVAMAEGIRKADPQLKIASCAMAPGKSQRYSKSLDLLKGLGHLVDIVTLHTYPQLEEYPTWKRSFPEDPRIKYLKEIEDVVKWRNENLPGKPVWLTEFGYDSTTKPAEKEGTFKDWVGVTDAEQARYIVRSYLIFASMDIERAYLFWFNDEDKPSLHASSGLTRNYDPKPSFHAVSHLQTALGAHRFTRKVLEKAEEAYIYEFVSTTAPSQVVWVAWSPTGSGRTAKIALPAMEGKVLKAERMPLASGAAAKVQVEKELPLTEDPLYVFWEKAK